ncbi:gyaR [Symbiodinium natans]|uniref:GyaR protein n=1 Tax=Symbiodinium natans TaxID=878477 RepID=A0A812MK63_9DINO|nr:gyaR [Symbiodinium natans]
MPKKKPQHLFERVTLLASASPERLELPVGTTVGECRMAVESKWGWPGGRLLFFGSDAALLWDDLHPLVGGSVIVGRSPWPVTVVLWLPEPTGHQVTPLACRSSRHKSWASRAMPFALCAVMPPADLAATGAAAANAPREIIGPLLEELVSQGLFSRVYHGTLAEDFRDLAEGEDLVVLVGSPTCVEVLEYLVGPPITDESPPASPPSRVKWVHSLFTGVDSINPLRLHGILGKRGIPFSNTRSVFAEMLAQHVLLSILYFNRQVPQLLANRRDRKWDRFASPSTTSMTMAVCGFGDIGQCCAIRARHGLGLKKVYGVRSGASRPSSGAESYIDEKTGAEVVFGNSAMDERVLPEADIVLAALPNTAETRSVFDDSRFSKFKPGALFINIGRGTTVDEAALQRHLESGHLRGAALDVFREEPLPPESPFWREDLLPSSKLFLTPHNADISLSMNEESVECFCRAARGFVLEGRMPDYLVNLARGY